MALVSILVLPAYAADTETTFERVMRTETIRCGYFTWAPYLMKDPNTGEFSGIYHDVMEEIGKQLKLKIEWTEETGQSNPFEGMKTGRYDMFCGPITPTADRAKQVAFSNPFFYIPYFAYSRIGDERFHDIKKINDPKIKVAVIDGEFAYEIIKRDFPQAGIFSLPALSDGSEVMLAVTTRKADVFLNDSAAMLFFNQKNPGLVQPVSKKPLRTLAAVLVLPQNDMAFKNMIDATLTLLIGDHVIDGVLNKYSQNVFLPVAQPYQNIDH